MRAVPLPTTPLKRLRRWEADPGTRAWDARAAERGVALPLALFVVLVVGGIILALAQMTTSEVEVQRMTHWDLRTQYLAQAGLEHQIYALKANKSAVAVGSVNYPVTSGQEYWYVVSITCLLNCSSNRESRQWEITSTGEIRKAGASTVLQDRAIRARVEIAYEGSGANLYAFPKEVTILRWEEVYP